MKAVGEILFDEQNKTYLIVSTGRGGHQYDRCNYYVVFTSEGEFKEIEDYNVDGNKIKGPWRSW